MPKVTVDKEKFSPFIKTMTPASTKKPKRLNTAIHSTNLLMLTSCLNIKRKPYGSCKASKSGKRKENKKK